MGAYNDMDRAILGMAFGKVLQGESYAAQEDIEFGSSVWVYQGEENKCYKYHNDTSKVVLDADLVTGNTYTITVNGEVAAVPFNTNHDTTMDDVLTAVTALEIEDAEGNTVNVDAALATVTEDANNRTLYIRGVGADLVVTAVVTGGASQATATITYQSDQVFVGGARFVQKYTETDGDCKYYKYDSVSVVNRGQIWMECIADVVAQSEAKIIASGANAGKFGTGGTLTVNSNYRTDDITNATTSDVMAKVEVTGIVKVNSVISWT